MTRAWSLTTFLPLVVGATLACSGETPPAGERGDSAAPATASTGTFAFTGDFSGPLGVQLWSFREAFRSGDIAGTLARVRALGFEEVELAGTYGLAAGAFRALLDSAGLRATSMHVGYDRLRDSLPAVLAEARVLGVQYVGTAWIPHPEGPFTVQQARAAAADFTRWGQAARAEGLQFFYHLHGFEFQSDADGALPFDVLVQETDADAVKFEMDVFWTALPGVDPAALLAKHAGRWRLMHLKDMRQGVALGNHSGGANPDSTEVPVGSGQIDYRAVLRAAQAAGVERYYVEDETVAPFTTIPVSIRWLEGARF